ncbi:MAG: helix-turn-helix domain-containing protein [Prevotella sp.]|nr:helix-turn-helix domain-containing protein [Prevotella sp.]
MDNEFKNEVLKQLEAIRLTTILSAKEVLTTEECAMMLGWSQNTLYMYTSQKKIPHYRRGRSVYFSKREVENWIKGERVDTDEHIRNKAVTFIALKEAEAKRGKKKQTAI